MASNERQPTYRYCRHCRAAETCERWTKERGYGEKQIQHEPWCTDM